MPIDLLIHSAAQLITCASDKPKRGKAMTDLGLIEGGAVAIDNGLIIDVGSSADLGSRYQPRTRIDASGKVVCPGFIDAHTHVVYAGDRAAEFEQRIGGATYQEIAAAGGGILNTVQKLRAASVSQLIAETRARLDEMLRLGTTVAEVKTGYGLDLDSELKMLQAIEELDLSHAIGLIPTFLGAHAIPPEYKGRGDEYTQYVIDTLIPAAFDWYAQSHFAARGVPFFIDVFCEQNAFTLEQSQRILQAGSARGMKAKAHVDEFTDLGGTGMAVELGAVSVDHLDVTSADAVSGLSRSDTIGIVLPAVNFNLASSHYADARGLIDAGTALALATDINPGSAPCPSLPLVMAVACRYQKLSPAEALTAVTINAAHAVGVGERVGSLEEGKLADVLVINAPDYRHLAYQFGGNLVETVIKRGRIV
ncbi:MAG TPA: imidazolonepropionase [Phototrophicaceae bacterium]|nr:imidazolonepropionase [Phototrophicaceae bacterium]